MSQAASSLRLRCGRCHARPNSRAARARRCLCRRASSSAATTTSPPHATARGRFEESLSLRRAATNRPATADVLARLGLVAYLGQEWQRAAQVYRESLALAQEVGDAAGTVRCLGQIAALALACGSERGGVARLGHRQTEYDVVTGLFRQ